MMNGIVAFNRTINLLTTNQNMSVLKRIGNVEDTYK
jgi:hypothetical protein